MNLPNKLTLSRIALTVVFIALLCTQGALFKALALIVFILASLTDIFDGLLAKRTNNVTDFGTLMDPIADKVLMLSAFLAFWVMGLIPGWMVIVIVARECAVTGLRVLALSKGKVIAASEGGRYKTASQFLAAFTVLIVALLKEMAASSPASLAAHVERLGGFSIALVMWVAVTLTAVSGISYLFKYKEICPDAKVS